MTEKEKLEKLKKLTDAMYYAAQHLTTDASRLHKAMDDYHRFIVYEYGIKSKNATGKLKEYIDKCKGCNNVKGCVTCVDGSEWAHYEESVSKFDSCVQNSDKVVYNEDMGCRVNLFQLNRVAKVDTPIDYEKALYKHFGQVKDFTLGVSIAKYFYQMGTEQKESVSEDLEEAADKYADKHPTCGLARHSFKAGAKWQKEQMLAKAVDGDITFDYYGDDDKTYGCIAHDSFCLEDFGLKDRDKVKLVIIKDKEV